MSRINVLHIISDVEPGGAQYCVLDFAKCLDRERFAPRVVCLRKLGALVPKFEACGIPVDLCRFGSRLSPLGLWRLRSLMREWKIDVVHTHCRRANHVGRLAGWLAGVPVLCAHHHDTIPETKGRQKWLTGWLGRRSDRIFCVSDGVLQSRLAAGDEAREKLTVFYNFIDAQEYHPVSDRMDIRGELGLPADRPVIGIVGRLHPFKNHEFFLAAANVLAAEGTPVHFAIVGDGALRAELEQKTAALGLQPHVTFTGNRNDMPRVYPALDVLALCSTQEGFPKVFLEAQACGVPVVTLDVGGVREALAEGGGIVVPERSPEDFARAIRKALEPGVREELLAGGRRNVARFSVETQGAELMRHYEAALAAKGRVTA